MPITVGILPNPASGRDLRRLTGNAALTSSTDKAGVVMRLLAAFGATGVERVLLPPDMTGIAAALLKASGSRQAREQRWPDLVFLNLPLTQTVDDTRRAARLLLAQGAAVIAVLGGDGTHKAVAAEVGDLPLLTLSTGTNNAFPELREATSAGLAGGLVASGRIDPALALRRNKRLRVEVPERGIRDWALVDVAVCRQAYLGARAVTRVEDLAEVFTTFAEPWAIGLSALCGLWHPVARSAPHGGWVRLEPEAPAQLTVPLAPGVLAQAGIAASGLLLPGEPRTLSLAAGTLALDGEREIEFGPEVRPQVTLDLDGPLSIDVERVLELAAQQRLLVRRWPTSALGNPGEQ